MKRPTRAAGIQLYRLWRVKMETTQQRTALAAAVVSGLCIVSLAVVLPSLYLRLNDAQERLAVRMSAFRVSEPLFK
jgi:hypothetical protein